MLLYYFISEYYFITLFPDRKGYLYITLFLTSKSQKMTFEVKMKNNVWERSCILMETIRGLGSDRELGKASWRRWSLCWALRVEEGQDRAERTRRAFYWSKNKWKCKDMRQKIMASHPTWPVVSFTWREAEHTLGLKTWGWIVGSLHCQL